MDIHNLAPQFEKVANVSVLILVLALAYQSGQMTLALMADLPLGTGNEVQQTRSKSLAPLTDVEALLEQHLFGEAGKIEVVEQVVETIDAPETSLNLVLQGVSVGKTPESSSAIISEAKNTSGEIYWIGDSVSGQAILTGIYDDRVVIKQNGRLETLRFDDEYKGSGLSVNDPVTNYGSNSQGTPSHSDMLRSYRARKKDKDDMMKDINGALNDAYRGDFQSYETLMDDFGANMEKEIDSALRTAGIEESSDGMKIGSGAQQNWMNQVGLKYGDVVKSVNGFSTLTLKSDRAALDSVIKSCLARIEVLRGANTFVVTYPFCK